MLSIENTTEPITPTIYIDHLKRKITDITNKFIAGESSGRVLVLIEDILGLGHNPICFGTSIDIAQRSRAALTKRISEISQRPNQTLPIYTVNMLQSLYSSAQAARRGYHFFAALPDPSLTVLYVEREKPGSCPIKKLKAFIEPWIKTLESSSNSIIDLTIQRNQLKTLN